MAGRGGVSDGGRGVSYLSLVWNTKHLLAMTFDTKMSAGTAVEYHLLSGRELYDKSPPNR